MNSCFKKCCKAAGKMALASEHCQRYQTVGSGNRQTREVTKPPMNVDLKKPYILYAILCGVNLDASDCTPPGFDNGDDHAPHFIDPYNLAASSAAAASPPAEGVVLKVLGVARPREIGYSQNMEAERVKTNENYLDTPKLALNRSSLIPSHCPGPRFLRPGFKYRLI